MELVNLDAALRFDYVKLYLVLGGERIAVSKLTLGGSTGGSKSKVTAVLEPKRALVRATLPDDAYLIERMTTASANAAALWRGDMGHCFDAKHPQGAWWSVSEFCTRVLYRREGEQFQ